LACRTASLDLTPRSSSHSSPPPPIFPGSAFWATFPTLALRKRISTRFPPFDALEALDLLPPGLHPLASMLCAVALFEDAAPAAIQRRVRQRVLDANRWFAQPSRTLTAYFVPDMYQLELFSHRRSADRLTALLHGWDVSPFTASFGGRTHSRHVFTAAFADAPRHRRFGVEAAAPELCVAVHDALVRPLAWNALGLPAEFGEFNPLWTPAGPFHLPLELARAAAQYPAAFGPADPVMLFEAAAARDNLGLARRLFNDRTPGVGQAMLGIDQYELERLIAALESVLNAVQPTLEPPSAPATAPNPPAVS
jgi:hypothetical protein